jgi:hypothetical protein
MQSNLKVRASVPATIIHCVEGHSGVEYGRFAVFDRSDAHFVIYARNPFPPAVVEQFDQNRIKFFNPPRKYKMRISIEDLLASDAQTMNRVLQEAHGRQVYLQPAKMRNSVPEITHKISAIALTPLRKMAMIYEDRQALLRLIGGCGLTVLSSTEPSYDRSVLCATLAGLCLSRPDVLQWRLRIGPEFVGWINVSEITGLRKENPETGTLAADIESELAVIAEPIGAFPKQEFGRPAWVEGICLEEGPRTATSAPRVAISVSLDSTAHIVGSWEQLFVSAYEPMAQIYPAFLAPPETLKRQCMAFIEKCAAPLIGMNIINYWCCRNDAGTDLIIDDVSIADYSPYVSELLVEKATGRQFDEETMSLGRNTFVYVQERLVLPVAVGVEALETSLKEAGFPVGKQIFFYPDLVEANVMSLLVIDEAPHILISFVYRMMLYLVEEHFKLHWRTDVPLSRYCYALDMLVKELEANRTTIMRQKVRPIDVLRYNKDRMGQDVDDTDLTPLAAEKRMKMPIAQLGTTHTEQLPHVPNIPLGHNK